MPKRTGQPLTPLQVMGDEQHHRARALLEERGLLVRAENPGGAIGPLGLAYGFTNMHGALWVRVDDADEARALIEGAGLYVSGAQRPIVDRSEPECPTCGAGLAPGDDGTEGTCASCGLQFHWVNIDEPEVDPDGLYCRECGYELTGNTAGRCPECSAPILASADLIVEQAARELGTRHRDEPAEQEQEQKQKQEQPPRPMHQILTWKRIIIASMIAAAAIGALFSGTDAGVSNPSLSLQVGLACGGGLLAALTLIRIGGAMAGSMHALPEEDE